MARIKISDLHLRPVGSDLFSDSESYMRELSEGEIGIQGGLPIAVITIAIACAVLLAHD